MQEFIFYVFLIPLLPLTIGLIHYRRLGPTEQYVLKLCAFGFVLDCIGTALWLTKTPNLWVGHIHTLVEFALLAGVYHHALKGVVHKNTIPIVLLVFTLLTFANSIFLQNFEQFNSYIKIVEALLLIAFSLRFFYKLGNELIVDKLERYPMFWINTAVLIYFCSNLFVFLYSNYILLYSQELGIRIWFIHALFFVLFNCLLAVGLWINPKNSNLHG